MIFSGKTTYRSGDRADPRRGKTRKIEHKTEVADNQRKILEKSGSDNVQPNAS